jgi:hypothetical protein
MKGGARLAIVASLGLCSCSETVRPHERLVLSDSEASALLVQAELIAGSDTSLAWLADSLECVLKAGTEAQLIAVTVDGFVHSYYGVGLTRAFAGASPFSTFHLVAFDSPSNPTSFLLANGYAPGTAGTPPTSVTGSFGSGSVFAHLVHVSGPDITDWVAVEGEAALVAGTAGVACSSTMSVMCNAAMLIADFRIDVARPADKPSEVHTVSQAHVAVPGILLQYN